MAQPQTDAETLAQVKADLAASSRQAAAYRERGNIQDADRLNGQNNAILGLLDAGGLLGQQ